MAGVVVAGGHWKRVVDIPLGMTGGYGEHSQSPAFYGEVSYCC
ncbi:hypothetical protein [Candidatus Sororendozoicomonas aggregata]